MPKILILYHYYHPDDVAGAQQFTGMAEGLTQKGWEIETWPCNRSCHHSGMSYSLKPETVNGVLIRRVWRPDFNQHKFLGRILNALWVEGAWKLRIWFGKAPDIVIIGTDPIFALLLAPLIRLRWPKTKIVHWCFDMYPEYPIADGMVRENSLLVKIIRFFMKKAYGACDLISDLGPCMREALSRYPCKVLTTHTPWALEEPSEPLAIDPAERKALFGEAKLGLLYSGNFGRPHSYALTLALARKTRERPIAEPINEAVAGSGFPARHKHDTPSNLRVGGQVSFAYSCRGSRLDELKEAVTPEDTNIRFVGFAPPERLAARLSAPDIHLVSLGPEWNGIVVPSKFFGALAAGRPVLFEGDERSSVAVWIKQYKVGWVLTQDNLDKTAQELIAFSSDPAGKAEMLKHCHEVYQAHFSKKVVSDRWDLELNGL
ncbi:MAG TPA: glycosyltransferase family 4 protein, partial [bacterium]